MDKLLYVAMTGAKETLRAQAVNNHNLANASTTGFRADLAAFQSRAVSGPGFESRVYATAGTTDTVPSPATLMLEFGGTDSGPPSPSTGWPAPVTSRPEESTRRSPARV